MNDLGFIYYSLKSRWLNSLLSLLLTAFGVSIAILIIQFENHLKNRLSSDGKGIDIVVGAKGSPLQLVLSSVYHVDLPTGNIGYDSVKAFMQHPQVEKAIPLALGDNWKGYRIVGTSIEYINHYNAKIENGRLWKNDFEVIAGSSININLDQEFSGSHGILEGGNIHGNSKYIVTGILEPTGTVLDRLLLTSVNSVLEMHGHEDIKENNIAYETNEKHEHNEGHMKNDKDEHNHDHGHNKEEKHEHNEEHKKIEKDSDHEDLKNNSNNLKELLPTQITAVLMTTKSPVANINLPRLINRDSKMQAANPALEITRLTSMLGLGSKSFRILSTLLITIAILSIFSGIASNLQNRMGDLAILRAIGYSKKRIFKIISLEGMMITLTGIIAGLLIGFLSFNIFTQVITPLSLTQAKFTLTIDLVIILISVFFAGLIAAMFPAYLGSKISVAKQLSRNV